MKISSREKSNDNGGYFPLKYPHFHKAATNSRKVNNMLEKKYLKYD